MQMQPVLPVKLIFAFSAMLIAGMVVGGRGAEAASNPFAIGDVDNVTCTTTPTLHLAIANNSNVPSSQNVGQWTSPTLDVAYFQADGATYYPIRIFPVSSIAAGSETTFDIPVERADATYEVAITATDATKKTISLLKVTTITPNSFCATRSVGSGGPVAQAPPMKTFASDAPTNLRFVLTPLFLGHADIAFDYGQPKQVDGYRLYRSTNGTRSYVSSLAGTTALLRSFRITKMTAGDCYTIVAVRRSVESTSSTNVCVR